MCMNELEAAFYKALLEAMAEEAEAHARHLRIKLAILQVREVKEGTGND